jgi:hypothetical protein
MKPTVSYLAFGPSETTIPLVAPGGAAAPIGRGELPDEPWSLSRRVWAAAIADDEALAEALLAAVRGCSLVVTDIDDARRALLIDDCRRLGVHLVDGPPAPLPEWAGLLEALADGLPINEAAKRCAMSLRTAHRRLGEARTALQVKSTTAAVVAWRNRRPTISADGSGWRPGG